MITLVTNNIFPPIPSRKFDWSCVDDNVYDGAPDAGAIARMQGFGSTEQGAKDDWIEQASVTEFYNPYGYDLNCFRDLILADLDPRSLLF